MNGRASQTPVTAPLREMEGDIYAVRRFADLIEHLGCHTDSTPANGLYEIGKAMVSLADRLQAGWEATLDADNKARGIPCA